MENNKLFVFIGAFLFGFSIILIILAVFFADKIDINAVQSTYPDALIGWFGATIVGGGIALRMYMNSSGSGYGMSGVGSDAEGDSVVAFVAGVAVALFALLATWYVIIQIPGTILALTLVATVCSFIGLVMASYFGTQSE